MKPVTVAQAIKVLNQALKADPKAISELYGIKVQANERLAKHKTIQVAKKGCWRNELTFLGLLNGVFGVSSKRKGYGFITIDYDEKTGTIKKFHRTKGT